MWVRIAVQHELVSSWQYFRARQLEVYLNLTSNAPQSGQLLQYIKNFLSRLQVARLVHAHFPRTPPLPKIMKFCANRHPGTTALSLSATASTGSTSTTTTASIAPTPSLTPAFGYSLSKVWIAGAVYFLIFPLRTYALVSACQMESRV
jgi:hypothetical protein